MKVRINEILIINCGESIAHEVSITSEFYPSKENICYSIDCDSCILYFFGIGCILNQMIGYHGRYMFDKNYNLEKYEI